MGVYDQFIWFGDSLTQQAWGGQEGGFGAGAAMQNSYVRRLDVINRGFSGYNTTQALKVLPEFMPTPSQASVRLMMIFFGANDSCLPETTGQHIPLEQYKHNLKAIATHPSIQSHDGIRLIIVTPPPVEETILKTRFLKMGIDFETRTAETTKAYADVTRTVGKELGITVLDLWAVFMERAGWKKETDGEGEGEGGKSLPLPGSKKEPTNQVLAELLCDGLHFTSKAYQLFFDSLIDLIAKTWPDLDPAALPMIFPPYDEVPSWA